MKEKYNTIKMPRQLTKPVDQAGEEDKNDLPGYPAYPAGEDIYNRSQQEQDIDPEEISKMKGRNENDKEETNNEKYPIVTGFDDVPGDDLDVPGAELDDDRENTGSEDEENNYYSLGGDNHNDLEEDKGE